ncbi:MAG TPA: cardiolipin synthase [Arenimonas sp.]|nr:cardiolipin synthase [Arenimonas sp.]
MSPTELLAHFSLVLGLMWGGYLLLLGAWIVLQKREPIATVSWLLALALLPVIGLLIYHLLGPQRIHRQRLRRLRARAGLQRALPAFVASGEDRASLARLAQASAGLPQSTASAVELLVGGAATYDALLQAIASARQHVHLEYYIVEPDHSGLALRDALVERAAAGVQVRLLLDGFGSSRLGLAFLAPLAAAGVEIAWFHPLHLRRLWRPRINLRNHRKLVVIDGDTAFAGGINIHDEADARRHAAAHQDLHLRLQGRVVRWLQLCFIEDWYYAGGRLPRSDALWPGLPRGAIAAQVVTSGPDAPWEAIHRVMVEAIHQAGRRVWLVTPYFVPGEAARMALTSAALRGLDVRLLLPRRSDSRIVSAAARSYYDELLAAGVRIFEYRPSLLHSKALLIDAELCLLGSANFDMRSFRLNFELGLLLQDRTLATQLEAVIESDLQHSDEITSTADKRLPARLGEACARLLSPLL